MLDFSKTSLYILYWSMAQIVGTVRNEAYEGKVWLCSKTHRESSLAVPGGLTGGKPGHRPAGSYPPRCPPPAPPSPPPAQGSAPGTRPPSPGCWSQPGYFIRGEDSSCHSAGRTGDSDGWVSSPHHCYQHLTVSLNIRLLCPPRSFEITNLLYDANKT